jgi:predicted transcriptional regulator
MMLDAALSRRAYLERLAESPAWKRDLIEDLGDSRSTVDRALETLQDGGLVERTEDGFRTTYAGRVLLDTVTEATVIADTAGAATGLLEHLPVDAPRSHRFFADATVVSMADRPPSVVFDRITSSLAAADRVRGAAVAPNSEEFVDLLFRRSVAEQDLRAELLLTEATVEQAMDAYADHLRASLDSDRLGFRVVDSLPFAFYLMTTDGSTTAQLAAHGPHDNFLGYVENDTPAAVEWLEGCFADLRRDSCSFRAFAADRPDLPVGE